MCKSKETVVLIIGTALALSFQCQFSVANVIGLGACPSINPTVTGTNNPFTAGAATAAIPTSTLTWYLHRRFPSYHHGLSCVKFTFTTSNTAAPYTNTATITGQKAITGSTVTVTGTITQRTSAILTIWDANLSGATHLPNTLIVAAYDDTAKTYLVLYSCKSYGFFNKQYSWILTTSASSNDANIFTAINAANTAGIPISKYETVAQSFC